MNKNLIYPQYRKYPNNKAYFKIISATEWEEIRIIGSNYILHSFSVKILPDRNYLHDMTFDYKNNWEVIQEEEYGLIRKETHYSG